MRVFICSPFRAVGRHTVEDNVALVKELCLRALRAGHAPYAPHLIYPLVLDDTNQRDRDAGIAAGIAWLGQSDEMWIYAEELDNCTTGMKLEVERAEKFSLPPRIVFMPDEFQGVKWRESGEPAFKHRENCLFCVGTGKVLEDHAGQSGYSKCEECAGTGKAA